jgi:hypothetical protein
MFSASKVGVGPPHCYYTGLGSPLLRAARSGSLIHPLFTDELHATFVGQGPSGLWFFPMCVYVEIARYAAMLLDEHYILLFCILRYWCSPAEGGSIPR